MIASASVDQGESMLRHMIVPKEASEPLPLVLALVPAFMLGAGIATGVSIGIYATQTAISFIPGRR